MMMLERVLEWLVARRLAGDPHRESTLGDLAEGYRHRGQRDGRWRAGIWYGRQAVSLLLRGTGAHALTRGGKPAGFIERAFFEVNATVRRIVRRPGFTVASSGVLTAGIAAALAAFSVTTGTYEAARWWQDEARSLVIWPEYPFSRGQLEVLRTETQAFDAVGGILRQPVVLALTDRTASTNGVELSTELFNGLRARPMLGRGLASEDGEPGAEPVVVLGQGLWRNVYGADTGVIGRTVEVNGVRRRIVGVMPAGAEQPGPGTELWMPLVLDPRDPDFWPARELTVAAVARPGVDVVEARDDLRRVLANLAQRFPFFFRPDFGSDATVERSSDRAWGSVATPLLLLLGGTGLLLLVAAIDVGNLALARSLDRRVELRVRVAIGASRWQVIREIMSEAALQAALAGVAGWALGAVLARRLPELFPFGTAVVARSATDPALILFVVLTTLAAWVLMAGVPTGHFLASTRTAISPRLIRRGTLRGLVVAQAALSTVLMVSAALLIRTLNSLDDLPLGFEPSGVTAVPVAPSASPLDPGSLAQVQASIAERLVSSPAVQGAGWISTVPLLDAVLKAPVNREDQQREVAEAPMAARFVVDEGAIAALGLEIVQGRGFRAGDDGRSAPVALVNRTMARQLWPDTDPVGRRIAVDPHGWNDWITVVGVIEDMRYQDLTFPVGPAFYLPRQQAPTPTMSLVVRSGTAGSVAPMVRQALAELAPGIPAGEGRGLESVVRDAQGPARVLTALLSLLAVLATALGAIGLYGSLAGWVARRRTEIGTRIALGASPHQLSWSVLQTGLLLTATGVAIGSIGAAMTGRGIRGLLFGVSPLDPLAYLIPAAVLLGTGILAAAIPALRAAAVPPAQALRDT